MKTSCYILFFFLFSCQYLDIQPKDKNNTAQLIASVNNTKLYKKDIANLLPKNSTKQDSVVLVKSIINSWATKQLLLQKAEENILENTNANIVKLVKDYRESLFINDYKERLIKQRLDTFVSQKEITNYYHKNKENFKLNEELIALKYIYFGNDFLNKEAVIRKFKSTKEADLEALENTTINFKSFELRDSIWFTVAGLIKKIPPLQLEAKENLLKISKFRKKQDSLGVYLVAVNNILKKGSTAPKSYVFNKIKQLILHQRKLELIREIEKTLINDAIKNKQFKEY